MSVKFLKAKIAFPLLVTLVSLGVYYYLFDMADRRIVFLYEHMNLKADSPMTMGRYWMAGLLLSGFLTVFYLAVRLRLKLVW